MFYVIINLFFSLFPCTYDCVVWAFLCTHSSSQCLALSVWGISMCLLIFSWYVYPNSSIVLREKSQSEHWEVAKKLTFFFQDRQISIHPPTHPSPMKILRNIGNSLPPTDNVGLCEKRLRKIWRITSMWEKLHSEFLEITKEEHIGGTTAIRFSIPALSTFYELLFAPRINLGYSCS